VAPATAMAAVGLQWISSVRYVTAQSDGFLIGGMVVREGFLRELSEADRRVFLEMADETHERIVRGMRELDERAYAALVHHGVTPVDVMEHREEWERVAARARRRLAGRVYPASLLERVERIAAASPAR